MDALSEVLSICRSERAVTARFALGAPWALKSFGVNGAMIRMCAGRPYWMQVGARPPFLVQPHDLVLLPFGSAHEMSSAPGLTPVLFRDLIAQYRHGPEEDTPFVFSFGGDGPQAVMFSAQVWLAAHSRNTVIRILPEVIHVRASELDVSDVLASSMQRLVEETLSKRPGWKLAAARMADLLIVHILRAHLESRLPGQPSWLRGLTDESISRAITAMHRQPRQSWTLATLASEVNMSRTRFSAQFTTLVGMSPIDYLTAHRMGIAASELEERRMRLTEVAELAGYTSEKAFSRAFRRWAGVSPTRYMKDAATSGRQRG